MFWEQQNLLCPSNKFQERTRAGLIWITFELLLGWIPSHTQSGIQGFIMFDRWGEDYWQLSGGADVHGSNDGLHGAGS